MSGYFIVLEGIDGSGSTTQGDRLAARLRRRGQKTDFTHEPTGGPAGMMIRLALEGRLTGARKGVATTDQGKSELDPDVMALLYTADRMDHLRTIIEPALDAGRHVVCDRYVVSSLAYQGLYCDPDWVAEINSRVRTPDLTIYLDVTAAAAKSRMRQTRFGEDLYEDEAVLERVRENYLRLIGHVHQYTGHAITVDAAQHPKTVAGIIETAVDRLISERPIDDDEELPLDFGNSR